MSNFQQYPMVKIGDEVPDWEAEWESSTIPHDKDRWRLLISQISQSPEIPERLVGHGWSATSFEHALQDNLYLIGLAEKAVGPKAEAAFVVLADACARIHEARQRLALELRQGKMIDLALPILDADEQVIEKAWTHDRIAALVGLTKQRVRELVKIAQWPKKSTGFIEPGAVRRSKKIAAMAAK